MTDTKEQIAFDMLRRFQRELVVPKKNWNEFSKFYYRSGEDIIEAVKVLTEKYGATVICTDNMIDIAGQPYVEVTATFYYNGFNITVSSSARDGQVQKGMVAPMVTNSASSFAKKQALQHLFMIDDSLEAQPSIEEIKEKVESFVVQIQKAEDATELRNVFAAAWKCSSEKKPIKAAYDKRLGELNE